MWGGGQFIEAHGTGTSLGDPIEISALCSALSSFPGVSRPFIGSVKTNIGHLESAAGIAGIIKAALSLYHKVLPASLHFSVCNPHIPEAQIPETLLVPIESQKLSASGRMCCGISGFGFGGTNSHIVLESAQPTDFLNEFNAYNPNDPVLIVLSAKSFDSLKKMALKMASWMEFNRESNGLLKIVSEILMSRSHYR